jgi:hypothetical protein
VASEIDLEIESEIGTKKIEEGGTQIPSIVTGAIAVGTDGGGGGSAPCQPAATAVNVAVGGHATQQL